MLHARRFVALWLVRLRSRDVLIRGYIALGKHPRARATDELRAGEFLLAIAGVRASDVASQEPVKEILSAPVNVSVVIGAMPAAYPDVIDGEARLVAD